MDQRIDDIVAMTRNLLLVFTNWRRELKALVDGQIPRMHTNEMTALCDLQLYVEAMGRLLTNEGWSDCGEVCRARGNTVLRRLWVLNDLVWTTRKILNLCTIWRAASVDMLTQAVKTMREYEETLRGLMDDDYDCWSPAAKRRKLR